MGGSLVALALLPILLGVMACLQVPIGDPERSRIDPALSGVWFNAEEDAFLVLEPYDRRTWLVLLANLSRDTAAEQQPGAESAFEDVDLSSFDIDDVMIFKGWLTTIRGLSLMTWEPVLGLDDERGMEPEIWFVWRTEISDSDELQLTMLDSDGTALEDAETRAQAERILRRDPDNPDYFDEDATPFVRVPQSAYADFSNLLSSFGFETLD